jgi:hypothetical protein
MSDGYWYFNTKSPKSFLNDRQGNFRKEQVNISTAFRKVEITMILMWT